MEKRNVWNEQKITCNQTLQDSRFDILRNKMAINSLIEKASFDMLVNNEQANEHEKLLIRDLALVFEDCSEKKAISLTDQSKYIDILGNIDRQYADIHLALIADLYNQNITFGKYNKIKNILQNVTLNAINNFRAELDKIERENRRDYRMSQPIICNARGLSIYCK